MRGEQIRFQPPGRTLAGTIPARAGAEEREFPGVDVAGSIPARVGSRTGCSSSEGPSLGVPGAACGTCPPADSPRDHPRCGGEQDMFVPSYRPA